MNNGMGYHLYDIKFSSVSHAHRLTIWCRYFLFSMPGRNDLKKKPSFLRLPLPDILATDNLLHQNVRSLPLSSNIPGDPQFPAIRHRHHDLSDLLCGHPGTDGHLAMCANPRDLGIQAQ